MKAIASTPWGKMAAAASLFVTGLLGFVSLAAANDPRRPKSSAKNLYRTDDIPDDVPLRLCHLTDVDRKGLTADIPDGFRKVFTPLAGVPPSAAAA